MNELPPSDDERLDDPIVAELFDRFFEDAIEGRETDLDSILEAHPSLRHAIVRAHDEARTMAGRQLTQRPQFDGYEILRELGRGGTGTVFLARHKELQRDIALKVLPTASQMSPSARARFLTEARALARIRHENVIHIHRIVDHADLLAYEMEWIDGPNLRQVIGSLAEVGPRAKLGDVARVLGCDRDEIAAPSLTTWFVDLVKQIADALAALHAENLIHRDIKPSNILMRRDGTPVLADFGLVHRTDSTRSRSSSFVGTVAYAPPEQIEGDRRVDERADVYSLGVTLYEALARELPFTAKTTAHLVRQIERGDRTPLRKIAPDVPRDLETIVHKAMECERGDRYESAAALHEDLSRLTQLQPILAKRDGPLRRACRAARRNQRVLWAAGIGAAAVGAIVLPMLAKMPDAYAAEAEAATLSTLRAARLVEAQDPEFAFKITRELARVSKSKGVLEAVQEYLTRLYPYRVLAEGTAPLTKIVHRGDLTVATGLGLTPRFFGARGEALDLDDVPKSTRVDAMELDPSGREFAIAHDTEVQRFRIDGESAVRLAPLELGSDLIRKIVYSDDGQSILVVCQDRSMLWTRAGERVGERVDHESSAPRWHAGAFLADGRVVTGGRIWSRDLKQGTRLPGLWPDDRDAIRTVTPFGTRIFVGSMRRLNVYEDDGSLVWTRSFESRFGRDLLRHSELSVDGSLVLATTQQRVLIFDASTGDRIADWPASVKGHIACARLMPDGESLLIASADGVIQRLDYRGAQLDEIRGHETPIQALAVAGDGRSFYTSDKQGQLRHWQLRRHPGAAIYDVQGWPHLTIDKERKRVAFASENGMLYLCDEQGEQIATTKLSPGFRLVSFSRDGRSVFALDYRSNTAWKWTPGAGPEKHTFAKALRFGEIPIQEKANGEWVFSNEGRQALRYTPGRPRALQLFLPIEKRDPYSSCRASHDGERFAFGRWFGDLRIADRSGTVLRSITGHGGTVENIRWSHDAKRILVACGQRWAFAWPTEESSEATQFGPHPAGVRDADWSIDERLVATACRDGKIRIFDGETREITHTLSGHVGGVRHVVITRSNRIVSAGPDGRVRWWWIDRESLLSGLERVPVPELTVKEREELDDLRSY